MPKNPPLPASQFTTHQASMLLVDEIVSTEHDNFRTRSSIRADNLFNVPGRGVPAYIGFELMAQTISIYDGFERSQTGESPKLGFLLGCRKYEVSKDWFAQGDELYTSAKVLLAEGQMRSFECKIEDASGTEIGSGAINVFRPDSVDEFLQQSTAP